MSTAAGPDKAQLAAAIAECRTGAYDQRRFVSATEFEEALIMSVLIATDLSAGSQKALEAAAAHARATDSRLTVLHCLEAAAEGVALKDFVAHSEEVLARARREAREALEEAYEDIVAADRRPERVEFRVELEFAGEGIIGALEQGDYELVVLGPTGAGSFEGILFGSTAEEVVRQSPVPVLVVPAEVAIGPVDTILAPIDLSECSRASAKRAAAAARAYQAELTFLHHFTIPYGGLLSLDREPPREEVETIKDDRRAAIDTFLEQVDLDGIDWRLNLWTSSVTNSSAAETIVEVARDLESDLIVMGTHGRRGFKRLFLGSTAFKVLRRSPCRVMVVR